MVTGTQRRLDRPWVCMEAGDRSNEQLDDVDVELRELMMGMEHSMKQQLTEHKADILSIFASIGGNAYSYRRERRRGLEAMVSGVYSAPRVSNAVAPRTALSPRICS